MNLRNLVHTTLPKMHINEDKTAHSATMENLSIVSFRDNRMNLALKQYFDIKMQLFQLSFAHHDYA